MWIFHGNAEQDRLSSWRSIVAVCTSLTVSMSTVVAFRLWYRRRRLAIEDAVVFIAACASITYNALSIMETRYGLGLPPAGRPPQDLKGFTVLNYASRPFYGGGICAFKIALCLTYRRLVERTDRKKIRWVINGVIAFMATSAFLNFALNVFGCRPFMKSLDRSIPGTCLPYSPVNYFISASFILGDLLTFLLPIPILGPTQLSFKLKLRMSGLFAFGLLTTVFSVLRACSIAANKSGTGDLTNLVRYACIEINIGIIMSCLNFLGHKSGESSSGAYDGYDHHSQHSRHMYDSGIGTTANAIMELPTTSQDRILLPPDMGVAHPSKEAAQNFSIVRKMDYNVSSARRDSPIDEWVS